MKIDSLSYSKDGFKPHVKSPIIWANTARGSFPLCYLTKPKSLPDADWKEFLDGFEFTLKVKEANQ